MTEATDARKPLTLAEFIATRRDVDDVGSVDGWEGEKGPGLVYVDALVIQKVPAGHQAYLWGDVFVDSLEALERRLYDFAVVEGHVAVPL